MTTSRYPLSFQGDENVPEQEVGLVAQPCEYTETHGL